MILTIKEANSGKLGEIDAEEIFVCIGRGSNSDLLKPEKCGIETFGIGWIKTNSFLETNVKDVWAIGDANGLYQFRYKANSEADIVTRNIFGNDQVKKSKDYSAVPWAIYTDPQIARMGMNEKQTIENGYRIYRAIKHYSSVAKDFAMGYSEGESDKG